MCLGSTVPSMTSTYTQIGAHRFKSLDLSNFLAEESLILPTSKPTKSRKLNPASLMNGLTMSSCWIFTNYHLMSPSTLNWRKKMFWKSETKMKTVVANIGKAHYQELQNMWLQRGMSIFKDFLIYYNNLDVSPFVQGVAKIQQFYYENKIDLIKVAVSVPGIARQWSFQTAHDAKTNFSLVQPRDNDLYYTIKQNIVGGPSIIFTRESKVGCTFIQHDSKQACANNVSYDANALYLDCIDKAMPCGGYVRRTGPDFNRTLISPVRTCFTGWSTSWRHKTFIFCMLAMASAKYASVPIWSMAATQLFKPCMNQWMLF